jgi:hypothetical protein
LMLEARAAEQPKSLPDTLESIKYVQLSRTASKSCQDPGHPLPSLKHVRVRVQRTSVRGVETQFLLHKAFDHDGFKWVCFFLGVGILVALEMAVDFNA